MGRIDISANGGIPVEEVDSLLKQGRLVYSNILPQGSSVAIFDLDDYWRIVEIPKNGTPVERELLHKNYIDKDGAIAVIKQCHEQWGTP